MAFIKSPKPDKCVFCKAVSENQDDENFVLWRGKNCFVILNLYPYTTGHCMVIPNRHLSSIADLTDEETCEIFKVAREMTKVISVTLKPDGFNIGMNLGKVAGAGIADHIHVHIVPRWDGDSNFMPVIGDVKVHPTSLGEIYRQLKPAIKF